MEEEQGNIKAHRQDVVARRRDRNPGMVDEVSCECVGEGLAREAPQTGPLGALAPPAHPNLSARKPENPCWAFSVNFFKAAKRLKASKEMDGRDRDRVTETEIYYTMSS
ncbi:uncharacterized protein MCYG_01232 [Microsporum canis CBS 113480]|uniref:Uncharacterized protein n=1 Tax=Arthroderma otae (strain ATCC MYA-4605 / CBS 113480) TaxID=554155 RepID=C5FEM0_ARTOC|nr:uncharacterized protein MCYG_01232 [Microsporum canis CBS 113480]EEQ28344.1 predicted protein [Microsporum canis CBS 113480]